MTRPARRLALLGAAVISLVTAGACFRREQPPSWNDSVDAERGGWIGTVVPTGGPLVVAWTPFASDQRGALQLVYRDGETRSLGAIHGTHVAVAPSGATVAVADAILGGGVAGIDVVDIASGERRRAIHGLIVDRPLPTMSFATETDVLWAEEPLDGDLESHRLVRSNVITGDSHTLATFSDFTSMELSPDRSRLLVVAAPRGSDAHGLWVVDLATNDVAMVSTGSADIESAQWIHEDAGVFSARDKPPGRPGSIGPAGAREFLTANDLRPGRVSRFTLDGSEPRDLELDLEGAEPGRVSVAPDGSWFVVAGWRKHKDTAVSAPWAVDSATGEATSLVRGADAVGDGDPTLFAPDGQRMAFRRGETIHVLDRRDGTSIPLTPADTWASLTLSSDAAWLADGSFVFFSNMGGEDGHRDRPGRFKLWQWRPDGSLSIVAERPSAPPDQ